MPVDAAAAPRTTFANAMPSHAPETMMWAASKSLYAGGDIRRSPCLFLENKEIRAPRWYRAASCRARA